MEEVTSELRPEREGGGSKRVQGEGRQEKREAGRTPPTPPPLPPPAPRVAPAPCSLRVSHTSQWLPSFHSHRGSRGLSPQCPLFV